MASFGHIAVGLAGGRAYVGRGAPRKQALTAMLAFTALSMWPDADYLGMVLGIPYEHAWGHRGATHSLFVALVVGAAAWFLAKRKGWPPVKTAVLVTAVGLTHSIFDGMTWGGGLGCAYLWPFSDERLWMPFRFIPVAPLGLHMLSERGVFTVLIEFFIFSPFLLYATFPARRRTEPKP